VRGQVASRGEQQRGVADDGEHVILGDELLREGEGGRRVRRGVTDDVSDGVAVAGRVVRAGLDARDDRLVGEAAAPVRSAMTPMVIFWVAGPVAAPGRAAG
jgi:hypothetical protein